MAGRVQVYGTKRARQKLQARLKHIVDTSPEGVEEVAEAIRDRAEATAPIDDGHLAAGQEVRYSHGGRRAEVGAFDPDLWYHRLVHEGTQRIKANPYLLRAAADIRKDAADRAADAMKKKL